MNVNNILLENRDGNLRKSIAGLGRAVKVALEQWASVTSSGAQNLIELVLEEGAHKVSDHVVIVAHVENRRDVKVPIGITRYWWRHANH